MFVPTLAIHPARFMHQSATAFLLAPGKHLPNSPVIGARFAEYSHFSDAMTPVSLLRQFSRDIQHFRYRQMIHFRYSEKAHNVSRDLFLDYIEKYRSFGLTEMNIVDWVKSDEGRMRPTNRMEPIPANDKEHIPAHVHITVEAMNGEYNMERGYFTPPYLVAIHEIMHAEEVDTSFQQPPLAKEMLTTLKSILLTDEVYKKARGISLTHDVDYHRDFRIREQRIPLGTFANFFRKLEARHASLPKAILSSEAREFLAPRK